MEIELVKKEEMIKIIIDGDIDTDGGLRLSVKLQEVMEMDNIKNIVFDMTTVKTTTSAGIGKMLNFFKYIDSKGGKMEIKGISESLYEQFTEIHLDRIFPISKSF